MKAGTGSNHALRGWTPVIGAFSIWFAHFLAVYLAALIWPAQAMAHIVGIGVTIMALGVLMWLLVRLRTAGPTNHQDRFARRFGLGSIFIATAAILFDSIPALFVWQAPTI